MFDVEPGEFPHLLKMFHPSLVQTSGVSIIGNGRKWSQGCKASRLRQATEAGVDPHMNDQTSLARNGANGAIECRARSSHRPGEIYESSMKPPKNQKK